MEKEHEQDEYERYCGICRRPESQTGKLMTIPGGMHICSDCMQRSLDVIQPGQFKNMDFSHIDLSRFGLTQEDMEAAMYRMLGPEAVSGNTTDKETALTEEEKPDTEQPEEQKRPKPTISFINLGPIHGMQDHQRVKKKSAEKKPVVDLKNLPAPHKIKEKLDEYVIGQEYAKKAISVAVYNHYKRVATNTMDDIEIEKSNMLMIGPTGCGKTYLVRTLARILDVPLAIADATSLTEAGYIGDDIESVISKLLAAADNDVERAESGIVFIDEIDKIARKKNTTSRDVSGESVQQGMLKLLEGAEIEVPVGATSKNAMVPLTTVNTRNILFICGGAFPDLDEVIKQRLNRQSSMGFQADLKDKYDNEDVLKEVTVEDLRNFGMIPEFLGRLPIIFTLENLTKEMLMQVLTDPKNAILKQYQKLLELDEVKLNFSEDAIEAIAERAIEKKTGARALRSIIEKFMMDIMFEIPKDENIGIVTITRDYIEGKGAPVIQMRDVERKALPQQEQPRLAD